MRTSTRADIGARITTDLQGECSHSYILAEKEQEIQVIQRRSNACSHNLLPSSMAPWMIVFFDTRLISPLCDRITTSLAAASSVSLREGH
jgi:hypothetical protein